ncbi:MAG: hypothetical protein AB7S70_08645 [Hyphomicrobium sp.]
MNSLEIAHLGRKFGIRELALSDDVHRPVADVNAPPEAYRQLKRLRRDPASGHPHLGVPTREQRVLERSTVH